MTSKSIALVGVLALVLVLTSCARLPEREPQTTEIGSIGVPESAVIPAEWGRLISVTYAERYSRRFHLWFEDDAGSIRVVSYDPETRQLLSSAGLVTRR